MISLSRESAPDSPRTLSWKKRILFWGVLAFAGFLVVEAGLRVVFAFRIGPRVLLYGTRWQRNFFQAEPPIVETVREHDNLQAGYFKFFPNETKIDRNPETGETFSVRINSLGFRGWELVEHGPGRVIRVVTLGASSTFGFFDKDNETYPYYLEQELNENAEKGRSFEVLNMGIPHLDSGQILSLFRREALPLHPDVVTFYEAINDSADDAIYDNGEMNDGLGTLEVGPRLISLLREARDRVLTLAFADSFRSREETYSEEDLQQHIAGKSERFLRNISALMEECRSRRIVFVVALQQARAMSIQEIDGLTYAEEVDITQARLQHEGRITHNELVFLTHRILTNDLKAWAVSNGVPYVDVIGALDKHRKVLLSLVHLSPKGNRMVAEAMAREVRRALESRLQ